LNVEHRSFTSLFNIINVDSTHPDIAALATPLFDSRIEGISIFPDSFLNPLCGEAAERVVQRSVDRVSRLCAMLSFTLLFNIRYSVFDIQKPGAVRFLPSGRGGRGFSIIAGLCRTYKPLPATTPSSRTPPVGRELKSEGCHPELRRRVGRRGHPAMFRRCSA